VIPNVRNDLTVKAQILPHAIGKVLDLRVADLVLGWNQKPRPIQLLRGERFGCTNP